jgi:hypothetical protein
MIGKGAFGNVHACIKSNKHSKSTLEHEPSEGKEVVVKIFDYKESILGEINSLRTDLNHENIV